MSLISTKMSHTQRVIDLSNNTSLWIGIGKTSVWGSPDTPPVYDPVNNPENQVWWEDILELTEPIGYKRIETAKIVVSNSNGLIEVFDADGISTKWSEVTEEQARSQLARHLYVTTLLDDSLPYDDYRQIAMFSSLVLADGISGSRTYLLPEEVESIGTIETIMNHVPQPRSASTRQRVQFVIEL